MKKKLLCLSLCLSVLLTTGCGKIPTLENGEQVAIKVDGKEITANDIYEKMKKQYGTSTAVNLIDDFIANKEYETDKAAETYADNQLKSLKLQYQQAGEDFKTALLNAGYKNENAFKEDLILDYKRNKVVEAYVKTTIKDADIKDYYDKEIFGAITARHILIKPETKDGMSDDEKKEAEKAAKKKAEELIKKLNEGADFATLAKENSADTATATDGGLFADFTKAGVVSEFWDASSKLKDGEYTKEPVKSTYGYHIILRVSQKERPTLEDSKSDIIDTLVQTKLQTDSNLSKKAWAEVRKQYNLEIIDDDIKEVYNTTIKDLEKTS